jgi:hypothetical protein
MPLPSALVQVGGCTIALECNSIMCKLDKEDTSFPSFVKSNSQIVIVIIECAVRGFRKVGHGNMTLTISGTDCS